MDAAGTDPDHERRVFSESLQRLKRHGCSLLLVGSVPDRIRVAAIRRLLGDDTPWRRRVVAVTGEGPDRVDTLLERTEARILDHASDAGPAPSRDPRVHPVESGLDALGDAIRAEIGRIEAGGPLAPGELRLSVDGLAPLVGSHDVASVGAFVESVGDRVRAADGMAHYVVPAPYDSGAVQSLTARVDATVELRAGRTGPEQRWHLPGTGLTTPWLGL
jgi:hypothetical protein